MKVYSDPLSIQQTLSEARAQGLKIGFVPTMGALHQGHLSLVEQAGQECGFVVASIFVNPTQFNDPNDLANYPRTLEADLKMLETQGCDIVFVPTVETMYPEPDNRIFAFGELETVMEGKFRPGHFNGVAQVVSKLFDLVNPDKAFFGQKDFQQLAIIKAMVKQLNLPVEIVPCAIVREPDGLAMSSRNKLLLPEYRKCAPQIYRILSEAKNLAKSHSVAEVKNFVYQEIEQTNLLKLEYFELVEELSLKAIQSWDESGIKVGCIAVFAGKVRLIDNLIFNR
jgi:pantoate--beta-alanine ligase